MNMRFLLGTAIAFLALLPFLPGAVEVSNAASNSLAQRVVLYEEDPDDPRGGRAVGSVIWSTETISPLVGPPELTVRADIKIPERQISMTWTLRRETDLNSPTSHTIEIMVKLRPDFPSGGILSVPGIWMNPAQRTEGAALFGRARTVESARGGRAPTTGFFLIWLSATPADKERNVQLLKQRNWIYIPIVYTNDRRAILAIEKGTSGEQAFQQAFAAWSE